MEYLLGIPVLSFSKVQSHLCEWPIPYSDDLNMLLVGGKCPATTKLNGILVLWGSPLATFYSGIISYIRTCIDQELPRLTDSEAAWLQKMAGYIIPGMHIDLPYFWACHAWLRFPEWPLSFVWKKLDDSYRIRVVYIIRGRGRAPEISGAIAIMTEWIDSNPRSWYLVVCILFCSSSACYWVYPQLPTPVYRCA